MPDRADIVSVCDAYVEALTAGDIDAIMGLYAADPTIEDPIGSPPRVGRDAVRDFYESTIKGVTMRCSRVGPAAVVGNRVAFMFRIEVPLGDETVVLATIDTMTFDDAGKIVAMQAYADPDAGPELG